MALNTILDAGTVHGCACHAMEHELTAYYDITHGHGLAILTPRWLTYILNETTVPAIYRLGIKVFGISEGMNEVEGAKRAIEAVSDLQIDTVYFKAMAEHACMGSVISGPMELRSDDVENIYKMCL